jgi:hypothetical protein
VHGLQRTLNLDLELAGGIRLVSPDNQCRLAKLRLGEGPGGCSRHPLGCTTRPRSQVDDAGYVLACPARGRLGGSSETL